MSPAVREARAEDAATLAEFNRLMAWETERKTLDPDMLLAGVRAMLADPDRGRYYVALEGDDVVGQAGVTAEWSDWRNAWFWWLQSVYVRADARRRGVFRALYDHIYQEARANPAVIGLRLYVEHENHAAQATYRRLGMESLNFLLFQRFPL